MRLAAMTEAHAKADPTAMRRTPGRPLAVFGEAGSSRSNGPETEHFSRETLQAWMQYMEDYGDRKSVV